MASILPTSMSSECRPRSLSRTHPPAIRTVVPLLAAASCSTSNSCLSVSVRVRGGQLIPSNDCRAPGSQMTLGNKDEKEPNSCSISYMCGETGESGRVNASRAAVSVPAYHSRKWKLWAERG